MSEDAVFCDVKNMLARGVNSVDHVADSIGSDVELEKVCPVMNDPMIKKWSSFHR